MWCLQVGLAANGHVVGFPAGRIKRCCGFLFEGLTGTTPGKFLFGLWVRRVDRRRCSWGQVGVRTATRLLEVNPFLFGALPAGISVLTSGRHQRIGDKWAGTVVVSGDDL